MNLGRIFCSMAVAVTCALGTAAAHAQTTPTLVTDAQDYLPGETAILMGSGFLPGETVDISIAIDDDINGVHIGDYDWMVELANDSGDFTTFWTIPLEAFGMTLRATALGLTSGSVATHVFHDSHGTHDVNFRVVGMETRLPPDGFLLNILAPSAVSPHPDILYTNFVVSTSGATSATIPVAAQTGNVLYAGFPATYSVTAGSNPGDYTRIGFSAPSGFVPGLSGATTTVVVTYSFNPCVVNTAPTLSASDQSILVCPEDGDVTITVTPATFAPVYADANNDPPAGPILFADGSSSKTLTFAPGASTQTLTLRVFDDPSGRPQTGPGHCAPLQSLSTDRVVTITASVYEQSAPVVTASDLFVGSFCGDSSITIPVALGDFNASATDPDGDPFTLGLNGVTEVTLSLPTGVSDAVVSVPVVVSATDDPSARDLGACSPLQPMTGSTIVQVSAHLYRNTAPVISATDADLGEFVGILSGNTFTRNVSVSPATFGAAAFDPDGDPVTLTADVSNVTLAGPGLASATVVLTATDDPSARTNGACTAAQTTSVSVQVSARIVYRYDGVLFPLNTCLATKVRRGSIVPVRFRLYDANNVEVRTVPVNPAGGPTTHTIGISFNQANAPDGAVDIDEISLDGDDGIDFNYALFSWLFILRTNSSYDVNTSYLIHIHTNDGLDHTAVISIKR